MKCHIAIDIGASSGRHIVGYVKEGKITLEEVYRFENSQIVRGGHECWDLEALSRHVLAGLKAAKDAGWTPESVGIDTWGVDFVLVDEVGIPVSDAVAYRDGRTEGMPEYVDGIVPFEELYARTGIQKAVYNTIYQLCALKREDPGVFDKASRLMFIPDYLHFVLTGKMVNEYTEASTSSLLNAKTRTWDGELIARLGLPERIFGELSMPGTVVGNFTSAVRKVVGFDAKVVLPASHDTGSAYLAVPARDDKAVYLSSGTWSLIGVENSEAITTGASLAANFSNEGGAWYRFRYLKNIMGLWMIQSIRRELNGVSYVEGKVAEESAQALKSLSDYEPRKKYSFADLEMAARGASGYQVTVDANASRFLSPDSMIAEVMKAAAEDGKAPSSVGELVQCVYKSLAECYAGAIRLLQEITGKTYTSINIVGGGSKDLYLNALTADATGLEVFAGPAEGTAVGNMIVQMIAAGEFKDLAEARAAIAR